MKKIILIIAIMINVQLLSVNAQFAITTTSSTEYLQNNTNAIYPAYVDNLEYRAWTMSGSSPVFKLKVTGGTFPFTWSVINGSIPSGLTLSTDGTLYGTPTSVGNYSFTVKVTDKNGLSAQKDLVMEAKPFRAKWFEDAKFGYMIQWGPFCTPAITNGANIKDFESRITGFDATVWASEMKARGVKVFNFTVLGGDGIRMWPSTTPTINELKTKRNIVGELISACHSNGIKFIAYMPLGVQWSPPIMDNSVLDNTFSTMNIGLIKELILMGVDGFWFDSMGSVGEIIWMNWDKAIPTLRAINPDIIFGSNPFGIRNGFLMQYPNADITIFEGPMGNTNKDLGVVIPGYNKKKIIPEIDNLLQPSWSWNWNLSTPPTNIKTAATIINSIKQNWSLGATYMLNFAVHPNGSFISPEIRDELNAIADFVNHNIDLCQTPKINLSEKQIYTSPKSLTISSESGSTIYYTLDGSLPTESSPVYNGSIEMKEGGRIRAMATLSGKGNSVVADYRIKISNPEAKLFAAHSKNPSGNPSLSGLLNSDFYMGMQITTGRSILKIHQVGRPYRVNNDKVHRFKIVEMPSRDIVSVGEVDMNSAPLEEGYKFGTVSAVELKPFTTYYVLTSEDTNDAITHGGIEATVGNFNLKIVKPIWTDVSGTKYYTKESKASMANQPYMPSGAAADNGELLNLKVEVIDNQVPENIALGKIATMENASGSQLPPSAMMQYDFNATDNDSTTYGAPSESYAWSFKTDLGNILSAVNEIKINSPKYSTLYATEYEVSTSIDNKKWTLVATVKSNHKKVYGAKFNPIDARFVKVSSIAPNGANQEGGQMGIGFCTILSNNKSFGSSARLVNDALETIAPKDGIRFASNALDGDTATFACADQKWNLIINLKSKTSISKVNIDFSRGKHPEDFKILQSIDGLTWTEITTVKCFTGGKSKSVFKAREVKAIQIVPLTSPRPVQISNVELL